MGIIKEKFEILGDLDLNDLQKATTASVLEDVFTAITVANLKLSVLIDSGVGIRDKSFSSRAQVKNLRYLIHLLEQRYKFLGRRLQQKKDKEKITKTKRNELHKLVDSELFSSLVKENAQKTKQIEVLKLKTIQEETYDLAMGNSETAELTRRIQQIMKDQNVDGMTAIKLIRQEDSKNKYDSTSEILNLSLSNPTQQESTAQTSSSVIDILDFSVLNEESATKTNPVILEHDPNPNYSLSEKELKLNEEIKFDE